MERKIWLKSSDGASKDLFKSDYFKNAKGDAKNSIVECLYFDTAELDILKNNAVLMACSGPDGVRLKAVFENTADMESEYVADFPNEGIDLSRFSEAASNKLKTIIGSERLHIQLASSFELKSRGLSPMNGDRLVLIQTIGCFEDNGIKGELSALEFKGLEGDIEHIAEHVDMLIDKIKLVRCPSPWVESMRIKASGFRPVVSERKLKDLFSSETMRMFSIRLFELILAYSNMGEKNFEKECLHKFRIEARKMLSLLDAFQDSFEEKPLGHMLFLESLLDDTDRLRESDMLEEEVDIVVSAFPRHDFSVVQQLLAAKRAHYAEDLASAYNSGQYIFGIISLWAGIQHMRARWESSGDNEKAVKAALENVKKWFREMNDLKKSGMAKPGAVHDFRVSVKKVRYTLENATDVIPKRLERTVPGLKRLQTSFGMACDTYQHLETLQRIADEADKETAYQCGICYGILATDLQDILKDAYEEWKDYRYKNNELVDVF